jgi:hypothetical protein
MKTTGWKVNEANETKPLHHILGAMAPGAAWCLVAKDSYLYLRRTPLLSTFYHTGFDHPTTFDHLPGGAHLRTGSAHLRTEIEHHTFTIILKML